MVPLDVREWLEALRLSPDNATADLAGEALEALEWEEPAGLYFQIRDDLEKEADKKFDDDGKLVEHFIDKSQLLAELVDTLDKAGFPGDVDKALEQILDELEDLRAENEALKAPDETEFGKLKLEYDL